MIFLTLCVFDLVYHAGLGALDYFNIYRHNEPLFPQIATNNMISCFAVACFSVFALFFVLPI